MKQVNDLQQKIEEAEKKKVGIETLKMAYVEEKLVQEAQIGIQHAEVARALQGEMNRLKTEDSMNDKKIQLANMGLEKMKDDFPTL